MQTFSNNLIILFDSNLRMEGLRVVLLILWDKHEVLLAATVMVLDLNEHNIFKHDNIYFLVQRFAVFPPSKHWSRMAPGSKSFDFAPMMRIKVKRRLNILMIRDWRASENYTLHHH